MGISGGPRRVYWSYVLTGVVKNLYKWIVLIIIGYAGFINKIPGFDEHGGFSPSNPYLVLSIVAILGLVSTISILQYLYLKWEVTDTEIRLRKGVFTRTDSRIPFERIHSVNVKVNLIDRVFGVVGFSIDTAGGQKDDDLFIPSLKKPLADELRRYIYLKKEAAADGAAGTDGTVGAIDDLEACNNNADEAVVARPGSSRESGLPPGYRIRASELFLHGISNGSAILYLFIGFSVISRFTDIPFIEDFVSDTVDSAARQFATFSALLIILAVLVILAVAWVVSVIASILRFFGFVARRRGDRIEIERGLLTHRTTGCVVGRIQEMHIVRPLFRRLIGYAEIRVNMAQTLVQDADNSDTPGVVIHPFIRYREIEGFLREILPEFADAPEAGSSLPRIALLRTCLRYFIWYAVIIVAGGVTAWQLLDLGADFMYAGVVALVLILVAAFLGVTAYRSWKGRGMTMDDDFFVMKRGAYTFETVTIPRRKIQIARMNQSPLQRKAKVADVEVSSASMGAASEGVSDVGEEQAYSCLEWLRPRG